MPSTPCWGWGRGLLGALRSQPALLVCLHGGQPGHEGRPWPGQGAISRLPVLRLRRPGSGSLSHVCSCHQWGWGLETWGQSLVAGASDEQFRTSDLRACVAWTRSLSLAVCELVSRWMDAQMVRAADRTYQVLEHQALNLQNTLMFPTPATTRSPLFV